MVATTDDVGRTNISHQELVVGLISAAIESWDCERCRQLSPTPRVGIDALLRP